MIPVIDARFQWKYTLIVAALGVSVTSLLGGALYRQHVGNTQLLVLDDRMREQVIQGDQMFLLSLLLGIIVLGVVLTAWGLVVTHRISGPLYLVANYLDDLAEGAYPDVRPLRKRDELQEFFNVFASAVTCMKGNDSALLTELDRAISEFDSDSQGAKKTLTNAAEVLRNRVSTPGDNSDV